MENTLISTTASVMSFDQLTSQWSEMGSTPGVSTILILKSTTNQYRYVAIQDISKEILLNCFINPELKYQESTETFHMIFQTDGSINGLNFSDAIDAKKFANAINIAIEQLQEELKPRQSEPPSIPPMQKPLQTETQKQSSFTAAAPSGTIKSQTKSRGSISQKLFGRSTNSNNKQQAADPVAKNSSQISSSRSEKPVAVPVSTSNSASAAPPPPPGPPAPPPPPPPPPPGPPPAPTASTSSKPLAANDFAGQLKAASLKPRNVPNIPDKSLEPTSNVVTDTPAASSNASGGDFLSEMRNKFKQRSNAASPSTVDISIKPKQPLNINKPSTPESSIQRKVSATQLPGNSINSTELDTFKKEIMEEIVSNMNRIRDEIIESISAKLNH